MNNIILIGYRGVGKTTIATILADKLRRNVIHVDEEIEAKYGAIVDIVQKKGWDYFRDCESHTIEAIQDTTAIIDCGGGVIEREKNIITLQKKGTIIWLDADVDLIEKNLSESYERPALSDKTIREEIEEQLQRRNPLYEKAADIKIKVIKHTYDNVIETILKIAQ